MSNLSLPHPEYKSDSSHHFKNLPKARKVLAARTVKELVQKAITIAKEFQSKEAELVQILSKVDEAKAYRLSGFNSLFQFCIECLGLSEHQSYSSITVARKMKEIPELLEPLQNGRLTVSKIRRMASVINAQNKSEWIDLAENVSQKDLERAVRNKNPLPPVLDRMQILSPDEVKLQATLSSETSEKFMRVIELLREKTKGSVTFDEALSQICDLYLEKNDPLKRAKRSMKKKTTLKKLNIEHTPSINLREDKNEVRVRDSSAFAQSPVNTRRQLPSKLKHRVWARDQGQCRYHANNKRCSQRIYLQIHHKTPVSQGGKDELDNLVLVCSDHHRSLHFDYDRF